MQWLESDRSGEESVNYRCLVSSRSPWTYTNSNWTLLGSVQLNIENTVGQEGRIGSQCAWLLLWSSPFHLLTASPGPLFTLILPWSIPELLPPYLFWWRFCSLPLSVCQPATVCIAPPNSVLYSQSGLGPTKVNNLLFKSKCKPATCLTQHLIYSSLVHYCTVFPGFNEDAYLHIYMDILYAVNELVSLF